MSEQHKTKIVDNTKYYTFLKYLPARIDFSSINHEEISYNCYILQHSYPYRTLSEATKIAYRDLYIQEKLFAKFCKAFPELSQKQALAIVWKWNNGMEKWMLLNVETKVL